MAIYQPTPNPPTWEEFEARCHERIAKIREAGDHGLYANMYIDDVEWLLAVLKESHQDYDGNPQQAYGWIMRRLELPETECSGPRPGTLCPKCVAEGVKITSKS